MIAQEDPKTLAPHPAGKFVTVTGWQLNDWSIQLARLERLLAVASDHLGEDIPYSEAARPGIDTVDALIDGVAALVRHLAQQMAKADAPL